MELREESLNRDGTDSTGSCGLGRMRKGKNTWVYEIYLIYTKH